MKPIFGILAIIAFSTALAVAGNQGSVVFSGLPLFIICSSVGFILHWLAFIPAFAYQTEHYFDLIGSTSYIGTVILTVALHPRHGHSRPYYLCNDRGVGRSPWQFLIFPS